MLWASDGRRNALAFLLAVVTCVGATFAAKLAFLACGGPDPQLLRSPSGHASLAALFFLSLGFIASAVAGGWTRRIAVAGCLAVAGLVAASRVALGAHNVEEAIVGSLLGAASFLMFRRFANERMTIRPIPLAGSVAALFLAYELIGLRLDPEQTVRLVARAIEGVLGCTDNIVH